MAQFTNQAALLYNGITKTSNVVTGEITQVLTLWKDSTVNTYQAGDILTYVISIQNSGTSNFTNLTLTDNLGAYTFGSSTLTPLTYTNDPVLYYINGVLQNTPTVTAGPPLVITNIDVLAGSSTVIIYRTRLNEYAPLSASSTITNIATLSGGGLTENVVSSKTVTVDAIPNLSILKSIDQTTILENTPLTYVFTIQNTGVSEASTSANVVISDNFSPILKNITVTLNGNVLPEAGNYTYNTKTGLFKTIAGKITVPAATYTQDPTTGIWTMIPGVTVLEVTGTI